jgi:hypothetical protein
MRSVGKFVFGTLIGALVAGQRPCAEGDIFGPRAGSSRELDRAGAERIGDAWSTPRRLLRLRGASRRQALNPSRAGARTELAPEPEPAPEPVAAESART